MALQNRSWESRRTDRAREAHWELGAAFDGAVGWCRGDAAFCAGRQVGASAEGAICGSWQVLVRLIVPRILCKGHKAHIRLFISVQGSNEDTFICTR